MNRKLTVRKSRLDLGTIVERIRNANADIINSLVGIGWDMKTIQEHELYKQDGYDDWPAFAKATFSYLSSDPDKVLQTCWYQINFAEKYHALEDRLSKQPDDIKRQVKLPWSQNQLKPLMKFTDSKAADIWIDLSLHAAKAKSNVTNEFVSDFLRMQKSEPSAAPLKRATARVIDVEDDIPLEVKDTDFSQEKSGNGQSESAQNALTRVAAMSPAVFPADARAMIEQQMVPLNEYELSKWDGYGNDMFIRIGRLLFSDRGLSFDQSERFVARPISASSTLQDLVNQAVACGGTFQTTVDHYIIVTTAALPIGAPAAA